LFIFKNLNRTFMDPGKFRYWKLSKKDNVEFLSFENWTGVKVFYSTRVGGVSPYPFDSLNLHYGRGDELNNVRANRKRFFDAVSIKEESVVFTKQVHSNIVNVVTDFSENLTGDGLITNKKGIFLGIFTADCLAVFLNVPSQPLVGILHVGWRGAQKNIVKAGIRKISSLADISPEELEALFGPSIGPLYYEVGEDFLERFDRKYFIVKEEKFYLNMWEIVKDQLQSCGVKKIYVPGICSYSHPEIFYSYRREGKRVGENLGLIGIV